MTNNDHQDWRQDPAARLKRKNAFDASLAVGTCTFNQDTGRLTSSPNPFLWAIDRETKAIRADLVRPRICPVCDTPPERGLFVKDGFRHVKCLKCGMIYVSLILREDVSEKYWREELSWVGVLNSSLQVQLDTLKYNYGLDLVEPVLTGRSLLDIGSGPGGFLRVAQGRGWETRAMEMNWESSKQMAEAGFQLIVKHLELKDLPPQSFDLISFWEVLEHLADPQKMLDEARALLVTDGLLLILVPNVHSLVTRLLHEKSNTFGGHSHLNHFTPQSLTMLLENKGFSVLEMETVITELGTINNHLAFEDPYGGQAPSSWEGLTPELIHQNMWGSRLLFLATKKD